MIIIEYIDIPNIKIQIIGIVGILIIITIIKGVKRKPKRKEVIKGNEICSMQWLSEEEAKEILGVNISNNDDTKPCANNGSK